MEQAPLKRQRAAEEDITSHGYERRDDGYEDLVVTKRQKSFSDIISLLDVEAADHQHDDKEGPDLDLSSLITTLQQEIISPAAQGGITSSSEYDDFTLNGHITLVGSSNYGCSSASSEADPCDFLEVDYSSIISFPAGKEEDEEEEEEEEEEEPQQQVIRHLLEASDDELGIPSSSTDGINGRPDDDVLLVGEMKIGGGDDLLGLDDASLWELEDEAANYYTWLQYELFP